MTDHLDTTPRPLISMALIVRNAAATLDRCLSSLAGQVDEIVVVDTGSTDDTRAIARRYTDCVFDFPWVDDFSAARQFAFDQATGEWVGWQDADEVLVGAGQLRGIVAGLAPDINQVQWRTLLGRDAFGQPLLIYWRERLVRNDGRHHWRGAVHENLVAVDHVTGPTVSLRFEAVQTRHEDAVGGGGSDRNLGILLATVARNDAAGEPPEPRTLFYLAQEYTDHGRTAEALTTYHRYLTVSEWPDERYQAELTIGRISQAEADYDEAAAYCRAMLIRPRWPQAYFGLAAISYFREHWDAVVHWSDTARSLPPPDNQLFVSPRGLQHDWVIFYTVALSRLGRVDAALWWTQYALGNDPDDAWHRANLRTFRHYLANPERRLLPPS